MQHAAGTTRQDGPSGTGHLVGAYLRTAPHLLSPEQSEGPCRFVAEGDWNHLAPGPDDSVLSVDTESVWALEGVTGSVAGEAPGRAPSRSPSEAASEGEEEVAVPPPPSVPGSARIAASSPASTPFMTPALTLAGTVASIDGRTPALMTGPPTFRALTADRTRLEVAPSSTPSAGSVFSFGGGGAGLAQQTVSTVPTPRPVGGWTAADEAAQREGGVSGEEPASLPRVANAVSAAEPATASQGPNPFRAMLDHLRGPTYESPAGGPVPAPAGGPLPASAVQAPTGPTVKKILVPSRMSRPDLARTAALLQLEQVGSVDSPKSPSSLTPVPLISVGRPAPSAEEADRCSAAASVDQPPAAPSAVLESRESATSPVAHAASPQQGDAAATGPRHPPRRRRPGAPPASPRTPASALLATPAPGQGSVGRWAARKGIALSTPARAELGQLWSMAGQAQAERLQGEALRAELAQARAELEAQGLARAAERAERAAAEEELSSARAAAQHMVGLAARIQELFVACEEEKGALLAELGARRAESDAARIRALESELEEQRAARLAAEAAAADVARQGSTLVAGALVATPQALRLRAPEPVAESPRSQTTSPVLELRAAMARLCAALSSLHERGVGGVPATPRVRRLLRASAAELVSVRAMLEGVPASPALLTQATMLRTLRRVRGVLDTPGTARLLPATVAVHLPTAARVHKLGDEGCCAEDVEEELPVRQLSLHSEDEEGEAGEAAELTGDAPEAAAPASPVAPSASVSQAQREAATPGSVTMRFETLCGSIARLRASRSGAQSPSARGAAGRGGASVTKPCAEPIESDDEDGPIGSGHVHEETSVVHLGAYVVTDVPHAQVLQVRELIHRYELLARGEPEGSEAEETSPGVERAVVPLVAAAYPWMPAAEEDCEADLLDQRVQEEEQADAASLVDNDEDDGDNEDAADPELQENIPADSPIASLPSDEFVEMGRRQDQPWASVHGSLAAITKAEPAAVLLGEAVQEASWTQAAGSPHHQEATESEGGDAWEPSDDGPADLEPSYEPSYDDEQASWVSSPRTAATVPRAGLGREDDPWRVAALDEAEDETFPVAEASWPLSAQGPGTDVTKTTAVPAAMTAAPGTVYRTPTDVLMYPTPASGAAASTSGLGPVRRMGPLTTPARASPYSPPRSLGFSPVVQGEFARSPQVPSVEPASPLVAASQIGGLVEDASGEAPSSVRHVAAQSALAPTDQPPRAAPARVPELAEAPGSPSPPTPASVASSAPCRAASTPGSAFSVGALRGRPAADVQEQVRGRLLKLKADLRAAQSKLATVNTAPRGVSFVSSSAVSGDALSSSAASRMTAGWRPATPGTALRSTAAAPAAPVAESAIKAQPGPRGALWRDASDSDSSSDWEDDDKRGRGKRPAAPAERRLPDASPMTPAAQHEAEAPSPEASGDSTFSFTPLLPARRAYGPTQGLPPRPRRGPTVAQDREFRRRAAALNIHVSPYFRSEK
ncbi:hypothetical protein QBZ16_002209 [Prototheca wickerhamii]|uniref:Uncharacterized protein n=1 Tax=Prototheca wickerhamii TaxID=3111 RepID=A0AAD9MI96_PROWI|nr:hypothetical protein QBZ16_002209 [Prototheca wickerhamii]